MAVAPPGPSGLELVASIFGIKRDTLATMVGLADRYGDIVSCRLGVWPAVLVNEPELIQHFLQTNWTAFSKRTPFYNMIRWSLGDGLATSDGALWKRQRRIIQPSFRGPNMAAFGAMMARVTADAMDGWLEQGSSQPLDVVAAVTHLTLVILGQALFSVDLTVDSTDVESAVAVLQYETSQRWRSLLPLPPCLPTARDRRFRRALRRIHEVVDQLIERGRQRSKQHSPDMLSMMLNAVDSETGQPMSKRQLRDELVTFLLTGHETITNAMIWTFQLLSLHPDVRRRLELEVDTALGSRPPTARDLESLPFCRRVIDESLRLYPPAWGFVRWTDKPSLVRDYLIPAHCTICISPYLIHRHPRYWENPEGFDPDRFLPENSKDRPKYAYIPFGGGARVCIGNSFALMEAQLILAAVTQRLRLNVLPGHKLEPEALVTLCPKNGLKMTAVSRRSPHQVN